MKSSDNKIKQHLMKSSVKLFFAQKGYIFLFVWLIACSGFSPIKASSEFPFYKEAVTKKDEIVLKQLMLTENVWKQQNTTLLFNEQGIVSRIKNGILLDGIWHWQISEAGTDLGLFKTNGEQVAEYQLTYADGQIALTNLDEPADLIEMDTDQQKIASMQLAKKQVAGTWGSRIYSQEVIKRLSAVDKRSIYSAGFKYILLGNGKFEKIITVNGEHYQTFNGFWQAGADGKSLIFYFEDDNQLHSRTATIKHLEIDELVLDQSTLICSAFDAKMCEEDATFFFNKQ